MKRLLILSLFILPIYLFGQNKVIYRSDTVGGTGLGKIPSCNPTSGSTSDFLNKRGQFISVGTSGVNYDTLYVSSTRYVSKSKGYNTIQAAINAASSGAIIIIYPGLYVEDIALKSGTYLKGNGAVTIKYATSSGFVITAWKDTSTIDNITILDGRIGANANTMSIKSNSFLTLKNCSIVGNASTMDGNVYIDSSKVETSNCYITNMGYTKPVSLNHSSTLNFNGTYWNAYQLKAVTGSTFNLNVDKLEGYLFYFGHTNAYTSDITGTSTVYKSKYSANYQHWVNYNDTGNVTATILVRQVGTGTTASKVIYSYQNSKITVNSSKLVEDDLTKGYTFYAEGSAEIYINNSTVKRIGGNSGNYQYHVFNSLIRYDADWLPWNGAGSIYGSSQWTDYYSGSHAVEFSSFYNKDIIPLLHIENSTIDYMGDDALNGLNDTVALKNLEVNLTYRSTNISDPSSPTIAGSWATSQAYTTGQILMTANKSWGDTIAIYVVSDHTSGTFQTDYNNNLIRLLYGARKRSDSTDYYQVIYLGGGRTWKPAFALGKYCGGKYRNRGSAVILYHANLIANNVIVNEHGDVWSFNDAAGSDNNLWTKNGKEPYSSSAFAISSSDYVRMNGFKLNFVGLYSTGETNIGLFMDINKYLRTINADISNVTVSGKMSNTGLCLATTDMPTRQITMRVQNVINNTTKTPTNTAYFTNWTIKNANIVSYISSTLPAGYSNFAQWCDSVLNYSPQSVTTAYIGNNYTINPVTLQKNGTNGDTLILTIYYKSTQSSALNAMRFEASVLDASQYYATDPYSGEGQLIITSVQDGSSTNERSVSMTSNRAYPAGSNYIPVTSNTWTYLSSDATYIKFYTVSQSVAYTHRILIFLDELRSKNIQKFTLIAQ